MLYLRFSTVRVAQALWLGVLLVLLGMAFALPRLTALGRFVTADEPTWGKRAATFYLALSKGNYQATLLSPHPGVTTLWAGAGAFHLKFPKYQRVGKLRIGDSDLFQLFYRHGPRPIEVLAMGRALVVLMNLAAFLLAFIFARRLFGLLPAMVGFLLIAFDPFYLAHSRLLHVDGLLSSFLFLSALAYLDFLQERNWWALAASGVAAGLGLLTKTPAILLAPLLILLTGLEMIRQESVRKPSPTVSPSLGGREKKRKLWFMGGGDAHKPQSSSSLKMGGAGLLAWVGLALLVVFLLWPAMWNHPVGAVEQAFAYSLDSAEGEIGGAQFVAAFQTDPAGQPFYWHFYPLSFLWRTTPVILFGLVAALWAAWKRRSPLDNDKTRFVALGLLLFIAGFALAMTLGSKKFDRYLLPVFLPLDLLAGLGWVAVATWILRRIKAPAAHLVAGSFLLFVLVVQAAGTLQHYPYYLTYYNPLLGGGRKAQEVLMVGWGEGLNEAAAYLRQDPEIRDKLVYTWYTLAFDWYSASFKFLAEQIPFATGSPEKIDREYNAADYIVVYVNQWQRDVPPSLFEYLAAKIPAHTIWIDGVEYVKIYKVAH